eukprot:TRINITY_DN4477_c0_g1_i1.p1 TRINITY_DN4477_c0_g1~~TRINITY_DN4477_c0_g1_i1.p1  ORF type:complete len:330 (+),score=38.73 TRINITY_DN4477_c0_g1_i1:126-1115(+)
MKGSNTSSAFLSLISLTFVICSLFTFVGKNLVLGGWTADTSKISPLRWVASTAVSVIVVSWGHKRRSLSTSGALLALLVGFCLTLAHYSFFFCLIAFFFTSSKATKYRQDIKSKIEDDFKEGGQRNWLQVLCNGGMATELALLYLLDVGSSDLPVDFRHNYRASWLGMGVMGAIACCNGDTWASELGTVLASEPRLITTLKKVPRGTNGGVSIAGLLASYFGGLLIGAAYWVGVFLSASSGDISRAPEQWKIVLVGGFGGLLGSLLDSLLGATLQYSGKDVKTGKIVEVARLGVSRISGKMILDNHSVNLISSILTALMLPKIALLCGL